MKSLILVLVWIFLFSPPTLFSADLIILTENLPPLNYVRDGELDGPSVDIVKEIQRRVGSQERIQVYPGIYGFMGRLCLHALLTIKADFKSRAMPRHCRAEGLTSD